VRIEVKEHPFGLFNEPFSIPVPVFFFEICQLKMEAVLYLFLV